jgi:nucleoid-associated protein YgaU
VLYSADGAAWSTKTETDAPPPPEPEAAAPAAEEPAVEEAAASEPEAEAARTYTVESGDTLWAISERFYGDGNKYQIIADASGIANPDLIQPGQVLTIP